MVTWVECSGLDLRERVTPGGKTLLARLSATWQEGRLNLDNDKQFRALAANANTFRSVTPWFDSTAFRTNPARYDHLDYSDRPSVAEEYLLSSRIWRHDRAFSRSVAEYLSASFVPVVAAADTESVAIRDRVELPASAALTAPLDTVIARRRSARSFSGAPAEFAEIAALVRAGAGMTRPDRTMPGRAVPSAGALYPVELHVAALRVTGLAPGLYRYAPRPDVFERHGDAVAVGDLVGNGLIGDEHTSVLADAAVIALLVGRPWRSMRKYGPRGLRFTLHEVGAVSEHLHLAVTALGLASTDWSSFYDEPASRALGLDGLRQAVLHVILIGRQ